MLKIKPLTEKLQKLAIEELGEVPSRIPEDLEKLKSWIQMQPHLKARTDDQFLIQFLRGCKYSLEKAKEKLDYYHAAKTKYPELFLVTDVDTDKFRQFHRTASMIPLPTPLHEYGPRIVMMSVNFTPQQFILEETIRYVSAVNEVMLVNDPYACINGVVYVMDFGNATTDHFLRLSPRLMQTLLKINETALPLRFKAAYIINVGTYIEHFFKLAIGYAPEMVRHKIFVCGKNIDDLGERLPKKYLPQEYGGQNGSLDQVCAEYDKVWDEYREYFKENAQYGTDERLRLGKPIVCGGGGELACGGSFRKLNVD